MNDQWPEQGGEPPEQRPNTGEFGQQEQGQPTGPQGAYGSSAQGAYPPPNAGYYGQGYAPPAGSDPRIEARRGTAIGALVVSVLTVVLCGLLTNIIGLVFSIIALFEKTDAEKFEKFTKYAWISNWIHIGLLILLVVVGIVFLVFAVAAGSPGYRY